LIKVELGIWGLGLKLFVPFELIEPFEPFEPFEH
jgi:hypothetical protein